MKKLEAYKTMSVPLKMTSIFTTISFLTWILFFATTSAADSTNKKFVVGLILPLSGELADYGEALRHGFELAEEDNPKVFISNDILMTFREGAFVPFVFQD